MDSRKSQDRFKGLLFETSVAFGKNSADRFYVLSEKNSAKITKKNLLTIDFGSQYLDGSSNLARTIHFGKPSTEQKRNFTNLLAGIIHLGKHVFPENMLVSGNIDILTKSTMWKHRQEFQFFEGSGIGAFLDVEECEFNCISVSFFTKFHHPQLLSILHKSQKKILFSKMETFSPSPRVITKRKTLVLN